MLSVEKVFPVYHQMFAAITRELVASVHGVYRGGLGVHLALAAMAGERGLSVDLARVPQAGGLTDTALLFSESPGRFIVTVPPERQADFEALFSGYPCARVGVVGKEQGGLTIAGTSGRTIISTGIAALRGAWQNPPGGAV